jgi:hypothetical protein
MSERKYKRARNKHYHRELKRFERECDPRRYAERQSKGCVFMLLVVAAFVVALVYGIVLGLG